MSNRDPNFAPGLLASRHSPLRAVNSNGDHTLNPAATKFEPPCNTPKVSQPSHYELEYRVNQLQREQVALHRDMEDVKGMNNSLHSSIDELRWSGRDLRVGSSQDLVASHFKEVNVAAARIKGKAYTNSENKKSETSNPPTMRPASTVSTTASVPPHLRAKSTTGTSVPPHLRKKNSGEHKSSLPPHLRNGAANANNPLVTDGLVDTAVSNSQTRIEVFEQPVTGATQVSEGLSSLKLYDAQSKGIAQQSPQANDPPTTNGPNDTKPSHPSSGTSTLLHTPDTTVEPDTTLPDISPLTLHHDPPAPWQPHYLATLRPLSRTIMSRIPPISSMTSFHPDLLKNNFGGIEWSPGLNFIPPSPTHCILRNRTYYTAELDSDPYLPAQPGTHGAKLVPFFNSNPEDAFELPPDTSSTTHIPLFVAPPGSPKRFFYYGHYSQTRWSDRLDYDRMQKRVPQRVRAYWAKELAATGRPDWMTRKLQEHLFPRPEYEGPAFGVPVEQGGSVTSEDMERREGAVRKAVMHYVEGLREWEREARMKTSMLKVDNIMDAFNRVSGDWALELAASRRTAADCCTESVLTEDQADADDPPALRLWWEYLECVDWIPQFYDMLVQMQARNSNYSRS